MGVWEKRKAKKLAERDLFAEQCEKYKMQDEIGEDMSEQEESGGIGLGILFLMAVIIIGSGFLISLLICLATGMAWNVSLAPLIATVDLFMFGSIGFFNTDAPANVLFGLCTACGLAVSLLQIIAYLA